MALAQKLKPEQISRARRLIAELTSVLDEIESEHAPRDRKPPVPAVPMPTTAPSREAVALVRRSLKRQGIR